MVFIQDSIINMRLHIHKCTVFFPEMIPPSPYPLITLIWTIDIRRCATMYLNYRNYVSMFNLFKRKKDKATKHKQYAPNTKIPYREDLIEELTDEHQVLLQIYSQILKLADDPRNRRQIRKLLNKFKDTLRGHLLKENTFLYVYLNYVTKNDLYTNQLIVDMQQEMGEIGKVVFHFLQRWTGQANPSYDANFLNELKGIGEVLVKRIENEENNLYIIYSQPDHFILSDVARNYLTLPKK